MKNGENKKKFNILNLLALCVLVVVFMTVPTFVFREYNGQAEIENNFFGEESELKGVLIVWNIDTFEGGNISKSDYLEEVGRLFENNHKGLYVAVKNMTVEEAKLKIEAGELPDAVSFGMGLGNMFKPYLSELNFATNVRQSVLNSGMADGKQLAIGYIMGCYALFSTNEKLINAGKESSTVLLNSYLACGYTKQLKNKTRTIYSLNYGASNYLNTKRVLNIDVNDMVLISESQYDAYVDFINYNKSTILLGTQRDFIKLKNKENLGKISGLIVEPLCGYNDLVQYIGVINSGNELRMKYSRYFAQFLVNDGTQQEIEGSGMFSTVLDGLYTEDGLKALEEAVVGSDDIPNVID